MLPSSTPTGGMMMSATSELTIAAERGADDHADGEIDDVALDGELAEFLEHGCPLRVT